MMVGPNCPQCGSPMIFLVIEETSVSKRFHFECLGCADDSAPDRADVPTAPASNARNDQGHLR